MSYQGQYALAQDLGFRQRVEIAVLTAAQNVQAEAASDVQSVTISGSPSGGTFTLTYAGQTTAAIASNAPAGAVQLALAALSNIGTGNVVVTGGPGPGTAYTVTFTGTLGNQPIAGITAAGSFTGGTSPAVSVAHTTTGVGAVLHAPRAALASKVLANPDSYVGIFALGCVTNAGITSASLDSDLQFQVNSIWNAYV